MNLAGYANRLCPHCKTYTQQWIVVKRKQWKCLNCDHLLGDTNMERYTIVVTVLAPTQSAAFAFVESAIADKLEDPEETGHNDGDINVSTQDGTKSTTF